MAGLAIGLVAQSLASTAEARAAAPDVAVLPSPWAARLAQAAARAHTPGAAAAIVTADGVRWTGAFGVKNIATREPVRADTLFQIGSVTKNFTATLLAALEDDGRISWNDRLADDLPAGMLSPESPMGRLVLRRIAVHAAGLPKDPPNRRDADGVMQPYSRAELAAAVGNTQLIADPWLYSNYGYALLGRALEVAGGRPYEDLLRARLLAPLGMNDTYIAIPPDQEGRIATHYWPEDDPLVARPRWRFGEVAGFGGVTTTIGDLAIYLQFQMRGGAGQSPVSHGALAEMRQPEAVFPNWTIAFGFGWFIERDADGTIILFHPGEVDGHSGYIGFAPAAGVGVVALANLGQSAAPDIGRSLLNDAIVEARETRAWTLEEALSALQSRQFADARAGFRFLVAHEPDNPVHWRRLGIAAYETGDLDSASQAFTRAAAGGEAAQSFLYLARIAALRGRLDEAFSALSNARRAGADLEAAERIGAFSSLRTDARWRSLMQP